MEKLREKERLKYLKKKEKGQVKPVIHMNARELRQKRKQWKENSKVYRNKKAIAHKNLQRLLDDTPPQSPASILQQSREDVAARNRRRMRRQQFIILYMRIAKLEKKVKNAVKLTEKYKKRYLRLKKKTDPDSPATKVNSLLKDVNVPESVKKKLIFGEALTRGLKTKEKINKKFNNK